MENEIKNKINEGVKKYGINMSKLIKPAQYGGLFSSSSPALYDRKIARSLQEEQELSKEGYTFDDDSGLLLWNILTEAIY